MIKASNKLIKFIEDQLSIEALADRVGVSKPTIYSIKEGNNCSSEVIAKFLSLTGYPFESAFEISEDGK
jgi:DNA-binding XRE family transcriptional regulator